MGPHYLALIGHAITLANEEAAKNPSRELSLTITKLEEAQMWAERAEA